MKPPDLRHWNRNSNGKKISIRAHIRNKERRVTCAHACNFFFKVVLALWPSPNETCFGTLEMISTTHPADMTPDDRVRELAAILATGVLRLPRPAPPTASSKDLVESTATGLEVPSKTVLSVARG